MTLEDRLRQDDKPPIRVEYASRQELEGHLDIRSLLFYVAEHEGVNIDSITVVVADHDLILRLNKDFLGHNYHTDVLSFPYSTPPDALEGDIYIDVETASERHREFDATLQEEIARYLIHGFLHLAGYTDKEPEERSKMKTRESKYLQATRAFWQ